MLKTKPLMPWVGAKRLLLPQIRKRVPKYINDYYEPFLGGGSVFFDIHHLIQGHAYLSDINSRLITMYQVLQEDPKDLMQLLRLHWKLHCREYFHNCKDMLNSKLDNPLLETSLFIYLMKSCYRGKYRENSNGCFNGTYGYSSSHRLRKKIIAEDHLQKCHECLQIATIKCCHFSEQLNAKEGDFVYFDPPYFNIKKVPPTDYCAGGFPYEYQVELRDIALKLKKRGVNVMLSNAYCSDTYDLYHKDFRLEVVKVLHCYMNENVKEYIIT